MRSFGRVALLMLASAPSCGSLHAARVAMHRPALVGLPRARFVAAQSVDEPAAPAPEEADAKSSGVLEAAG